MTVLARRVISEPLRSAVDTWKVIVNLLVPDSGCSDRKELLDITGLASSIIASEAIKEAPIVVYGGGPRVRIYGLYGEDAINGEDADESQFVANVLDGEWTISLPCLDEDLEWVQKALKNHTTRITAREISAVVENESESNSLGKSTNINLEAFLRP